MLLLLLGFQVHTTGVLWMAVREATRNGTCFQFQPSGEQVGQSWVPSQPELQSKTVAQTITTTKQCEGQKNSLLSTSAQSQSAIPLDNQLKDKISVFFNSKRLYISCHPARLNKRSWPAFWRLANHQNSHHHPRELIIGAASHSHDGVITIICVEYDVGVHMCHSTLTEGRGPFCGIYVKSGIELRSPGLYNRWIYSLSGFTSPSCQTFYSFTI